MSSAAKLKSSDVDVVATISAAVAAAVSACLVFLVLYSMRQRREAWQR
jgi:hypothetical protein